MKPPKANTGGKANMNSVVVVVGAVGHLCALKG